MKTEKIRRNFFTRNTVQVARDLLGTRLVKIENGERIGGIICETEAYRGEEDQGCHAKAGRTARTQVMYGPAGHAYVYFTYGMHWMLNAVCEQEGYPAAVLIRAIWPAEGVHLIKARRSPQPQKYWTNGPGKLCQALAIDGRYNQLDLCAPDGVLFIEQGDPIPDSAVTTGPRVGFNNVPEPWLSMPWRFMVLQNFLETLDLRVQE
jgi:DNA-3-methyladenine glycosylase